MAKIIVVREIFNFFHRAILKDYQNKCENLKSIVRSGVIVSVKILNDKDAGY